MLNYACVRMIAPLVTQLDKVTATLCIIEDYVFTGCQRNSCNNPTYCPMSVARTRRADIDLDPLPCPELTAPYRSKQFDLFAQE